MCRLSSREKISLQDLSKERRPGGAGGPSIRDEDDGEEASAGRDAKTPGSEEGVLGLDSWDSKVSEVADISFDIPFLFLFHRAPSCGTKSP